MQNARRFRLHFHTIKSIYFTFLAEDETIRRHSNRSNGTRNDVTRE